nr:T9SS type A sorting domain-containing protein [Saprospiraceae bacterium]
GITVYLNGQSATHNFNVPPVDFSSLATYLGSYRGWDGRNFTGLMDEVRFYNRALSTEEIRRRRHLVSNPDEEENLVAYFQFNELAGLALNKLGNQHAQLAGYAGRSLSTAPVGSGESSQLLIQSPGNYSFGETGLSLAFGATATLPAGPVVASRLNVPPDYQPGPDVLPASGYWILNNYGANENWGPVQSLTLGGIPVPAAAEGQPDAFTLHHRADNAEGDSWSSAIDEADAAIAGDTDGTLTFSAGNSLSASGQLIIGEGELVGAYTQILPDSYVLYPNPLRRHSELNIRTDLPGAYTFELFDASGQLVYRASLQGNVHFPLAGLSAGAYAYRVVGARHMRSGSLVIF